MKKIFLILLLSVATIGTYAQTILNNSKWFDGAVLYRASVEGQIVKLRGVGSADATKTLTLRRTDGPIGEYELAGSASEAQRFRAQMGAEAACVSGDGMMFISIRDANGATVWTLAKTIDNREDCLGKQQWAENQPPLQLKDKYLMNVHYLSSLPTSAVRQLYQTLYGEQEVRQMSVLETSNISLLESELRYRGESVSMQEPSVEEEPMEGAPVGEEIVVGNEVEFLNALGSSRTIVVKKGVTLNLTRVLDNRQMFTSAGRLFAGPDAPDRMIVEGRFLTADDAKIASVDVFDGRELVLMNMFDLTIRGESGAKIVVEPRYAFIFNLVGCANVNIENLILGHTEGGYCAGGVIGISKGGNIFINNSDLYGCGTYGLVADNTSAVRMSNSNIHDCTYGIMELKYAKDVTFTHCDFYRNREFGLVESYYCDGVTFTDCRFHANDGTAALFAVNHYIVLDGCEVYHPSQLIGNADMILENGAKTKWVNKNLDQPLKSRGCGPK